MSSEGQGRTTVVKSGGGGMGLLLGIAVLAVVAMVAVFLVVNANRETPGQQVADAASSIAGSASRAADSAATATSRAAERTADAVNPAN